MSRLEIDADRCTGHGRCYDLVPSLFEPDDYGHGLVIAANAVDFEPADALAAVRNCPEHAIRFGPPHV